VERVFKHKSWLHPPANHIGLTVHELVQE
jgi:hypothetical protein